MKQVKLHLTNFNDFRFPIVLIIILFWFSVSSQNLVPNPGFETYTTCPVFYTLPGDPLPCPPWIYPTWGTSDYFNACAIQFVDVPTNFTGYQYAHTGDAYGGFLLRTAAFDYHEYLQVQLDQPLVAGTNYYVSFYVSLADAFCGIEHIGAYLSVFAPMSPEFVHLNLDPQVESDMGFLANELGWTLISGCYVATGGEQYITIGNFHASWDTPIDPDCGSAQSYYYLDDITVVDTMSEDLFFDLGGPVTACNNYFIDPGVTGNTYAWSDGSHDPTLTVDQSGTYSVTISSGCLIGEAEIEVTIIGGSIVEIAQDDVTLCPGEILTISLDPALGDYVWNDGSTSTEYQITNAGEYSVTLDNGCEQTEDMITVQVLQPPDPFSLGEDTTLCDGDDISFSFDPLWGDFEWNDGSTSPDHSLDEEGSFMLTISNMCGEVTDDIQVDIIDIPEIELGDEDIVLCFGEQLVLSLDPDAGPYVWQDSSISSTYTITQAGEYSVSATNICGQNFDNILVEVLFEPHIDFGDSITICPAQIPYALNVSNVQHATDFLWQDGSLDSVFQVTVPGLYSVTVSNECFSSVDTVQIFIDNAMPSVVLPDSLILCPGEIVALNNNGSIGNYLWQDSTVADTFLVSFPGIYSLTVTNICGSASDTVVVDYISAMGVPDLGPDFSLCPGQQFVLSAGIQGVSYLWQDMSTADSLMINSAGIYSVTVSDQCTSVADTIMVILNDQPPQVDLPQQLNLCQGESLTLYAGINGVSYLWNDNSQTDSLEVFSPGTYSLTVSNTCGVDVDTVIISDGGPQPTVALGVDVSLCSGEAVTLLPVFSDVDNWFWHDGSHLTSYTLTGNEIVTVEVSNACGNAFDTLIASLLPDTPPIDLGPDTSLCPGSSLLLTINTPNVSIEWPDGSGNSQYLIEDAGIFFATISNSCGENADTIDVGLLPAAPVLNLGIDQSLCPGEIITFDPGVLNANYLWQDGSNGDSFSATQPGLIILTVSNSCGFDIDTVEIIISTDGPDVNLGPDVLACEGDVITLESDISGVDYLWQDGSTLAEYSTTISGTFILEVSNNCGVDIDTIDVDIHGTPPVTELGPDTTLCTGSTLILYSTSDAETLIEWQDGTSAPTFIVNGPGTFSIQETNHCGTNTDTITFDFIDAPSSFDLGPDTILCPGEFITLNAPITSSAIRWQDGSNGPSIIADQSQTYSLEISNDCGIVNDVLVLSYDQNIPEVTLSPVTFICPGDQVELNVTQPFPANYIWSTGSILPMIVIDLPGIYSVTIQALCGEAEGATEAMASDSCHAVNTFFIPNVFSPNGDNINDIFTITFNDEIEVHAIEASIFDRWGNMMFHSESIPMEWKGDFKGEKMNPGVYVYKIEVAYFDKVVERTVILHGDVTLIR